MEGSTDACDVKVSGAHCTTGATCQGSVLLGSEVFAVLLKGVGKGTDTCEAAEEAEAREASKVVKF